MSQRKDMDSLFSDDPFFSQERLLWPLHQEALSSLQQDFFHRRTKLAEGLLKELHDGSHLLDLHRGAFPGALFASLGAAADPHQEVCSAPEPCGAAAGGRPGPGAAPPGASEDLLVTLDVRGYAPEDIHVKLEGRRLAVVAMKRAAAEASQDASSDSCSSSRRSAAASRAGFVQNIELPAHLDLAALSCTLTEGGRLRVEAPAARRPIAAGGEAEREEPRERPAPPQPEERAEEQEEEPARFKSTLEFPITKDN